MAEFPDLGKHCALSSCQILDFTPHLCPRCKQHFCGDHRLSHGCLDSDANASTADTGSSSSALPVRPFLCAKSGCFNRESVKIVCPDCSQNFCLSHRHADEHECKYQETVNDVVNCEKEAVKKAVLEKLTQASKEEKPEAVAPVTKQKKVLSVTEQKRQDKIEVMRLKSKTSNANCGILPADRMFIFAKVYEPEERRLPVMIHKKWTVGRCVDKIAKDLSIENNNGVPESKKIRLYKNEAGEFLPMADNIVDYCGADDLEMVVLKRDL
ncbi:hypothetical protein QR680_012493 [Steinernema hermaphroditum]|uniref:AN1-type domain-containing protein n=1 Tax=Steinernema hermaphroditum TaxID=289476 RepID=A0AA39M0U8_9BILA|nr:hypothetical protein QR680_012493 [Steinernema hermaphroditum]